MLVECESFDISMNNYQALFVSSHGEKKDDE